MRLMHTAPLLLGKPDDQGNQVWVLLGRGSPAAFVSHITTVYPRPVRNGTLPDIVAERGVAEAIVLVGFNACDR